MQASPEQKRHVNYYMQMIKKTMGIMCLVIFSLQDGLQQHINLEGTSSKLALPINEDRLGGKLEKFKELIMVCS